MVAYTFRMPAGIPGDVNRIQAATIEPQIVTPFGTTGAPTAFGIPMVVDATTGWARMLASGDTAVYGVLVRSFPTGATQDPLGTSTPPANGPVDILRRGYISILLSGTQAAIDAGQAYVWTAAASGSHIVGGWEAASPGGSGFTVTGSFYKGPADANGFTELAFNI